MTKTKAFCEQPVAWWDASKVLEWLTQLSHSAVRENHEETGLPDVFDISNDSEKDRWRLVNSRVPKATYNSNSGQVALPGSRV